MTTAMTPEKVMAWMAIITFVGSLVVTVAGYFLHQRDAAQAKEMERLEKSLEAAWKKIDDMRIERTNYFTREDYMRWSAEIKADNAALRAEIKSDMTAMSVQVIREIERVSAMFREDLKRVVSKN